MRWRRRGPSRATRAAIAAEPVASEPTARAAEPVVLTVTEPVTRQTADALTSQVNRLAPDQSVVLDLTAIPSFDTDGATALVGLQESVGTDRLTIVGLRQATSRLLGSDDVEPAPAMPQSVTTVPWVLRRLRAIAVVQTVDDRPTSTEGFEPVIASALDTGVGIVVIDLRGAQLTANGAQAIGFASSQAAVSGQELLVVNVDEETAERLRRIGLSATTYVAPAPPPD